VANGGRGNDTIEIDSGVLQPVELMGGDGDDLIIAGGGPALIQGGAGRDTLMGGTGDAVIYGHSISGVGDDGAADVLVGGTGNDRLYGQGGNDFLDGGDGDDYLDGGAGDDRLFGGAGNDWLYGGAGMDLLYGEQGDDLLEGGAGIDWLYGGAGNDVLYGHDASGIGDDDAADLLFGDFGTGHVGAQDRMGGTPGNDVLFGQGGDDFLSGEEGDDLLYGGTGADTILGGAGEDQIWGEDGDDLIRGGTGVDLIWGGAGNDRIFGDAGDDIIYGEAGNDRIFGGSGEDLIYGGDGDDYIRGQAGDDRIYGEDGNDRLYGDAGEDLILGGAGNDELHGGAGSDRLYGGSGDDTLYGGADDDQLYGEAGHDRLFGNAGRDRLYGGIGNDHLFGNDGDDHLLGEAGDDVLEGGIGDDLLEGGSGADTLRGGVGNDVLLAGTGLGKVLHGDDGDDIIVGADSGGDDPDLFDSIYFGDVIFGGAGDDRIWGLGGADIIDGGDGDDEIWGGEHGDLIRGSAGRDRLYGGFGADWISGGDDGDYIDGGLGADRLYGDAGDDEILGGGGSGDLLHGGDGDDILRGSDDGDDVIHGDAGRDRLYGNRGNDHLLGGDGDDIIEGGDGDDLIEGGAGADVLVGGAGHDTLYGHSVSGVGDDDAADWLYGDFGTNADEPGSGADRLFGQGGNDLLYGEGADDFIDALGNGYAVFEAGGGSSNLVDFGSGESATPSNFVAPTPTPSPTPVATRNEPLAPNTLPTDPDVAGLWRELAGSASGGGLSGGVNLAVEPSVATDAAGHPIVAWADARNGNFEIYVLRHDGSAWRALGGSAAGGGVSATAGSSRQPALTFDASGAPVVAWIETASNGTSDVRVARYDAGTQAWVALGSSLSATGISGTGMADGVQLVDTTAGLVAVWLDGSSGTTQVFARRFDGSNWVAMGSASGSGVSAAPTAVSNLAVTTDGTRVAVAWAREVAGLRQVYVKEFNGANWQGLAGSDSGNGLSAGIGDSWQPSLAYHDGQLFVAWQSMDIDGYQNLVVSRHQAGAWSAPAAVTEHGPTTDNATIARDARLAAGGDALWLFWTDEDTRRADQPQALYGMVWNGVEFAPRIAADADGDGISETGGRLSGAAVTVDPAGRPVVVWSEADRGFSGDPALPAIYLRADAPVINRVFQPADQAELLQILETQSPGAGDVIVLPQGFLGGFTLGASASGVTLVGAPAWGTQVNGTIVIEGASNVTLQGLTFGGLTFQGVTLQGGVHVQDADGFTLRDSRFGNARLTLDGGSDVRVVHNQFGGAGVSIVSATSGRVAWNDIQGTLSIAAPFAGSIDHNSIHGAAIGVDYAAPADLLGNRIFGNDIGVRTSVGGTADALGFTAGGGTNEIFDNATGIESVGAQFQLQHVYGNTVGVRGTGIVGGASLDQANLIERNGTGIANFTGTVQYSRIAGNGIGIQATNGLRCGTTSSIATPTSAY
jgi:Ca2+-binding RTX toxin-like protein